MKSAGKAVVLFILLGAALAHAQSLPNFQHVIIVVQENRSPDNLFGGAVAAAGYPPGFPTLAVAKWGSKDVRLDTDRRRLYP
jgi:phospholipase C